MWPQRGVLWICAGATLLGIGVLIGGVSALRDGEAIVGIVVTVCGVLGVAFGASGLVLTRRKP